jgi:hypothetical protein
MVVGRIVLRPTLLFFALAGVNTAASSPETLKRHHPIDHLHRIALRRNRRKPLVRIKKAELSMAIVAVTLAEPTLGSDRHACARRCGLNRQVKK